MKRKIFTLIAAAVMLAAAVGLTSCQSKSYYEQLDEKGYTVSVTFDANGGKFKGTESTVIDAFNPNDYATSSDGMKHISLLTPDDSRRDKNNALTVTNPEYFLAGWYTERTPIDPNDLSKGYTYSGRWDFENDTLKIDPSKSYTSAQSAVTLYAAWIPYYNFEFYAKDSSGNFALYDTVKALDINVPEWEVGDVTLDMKKFPSRDGYTLVGAYSDKELTTAYNGTIKGLWDEATATSLTPTIKVYTDWEEGSVYHIYAANDLYKNANLNGRYEILADLDFSRSLWPTAFVNGKFEGEINGNGHKISNVSISNNGSKTRNGLFGTVAAGAVIKNVAFENVKVSADLGRIVPGAYFGLFAGEIASDASFTDVTVSGKIVLGDSCAYTESYSQNYEYALLSPLGTATGITYNITCEKASPENERFGISLEDGKITITFPAA